MAQSEKLQAPKKLTAFEKATVEVLVSYRVSKKEGETKQQVKKRIEQLCRCPMLQQKAINLVKAWDEQRKNIGLKPWNDM